MDRLEIAHRPMRKEPDENIYMLGIPLTIVLCSLGVALVAHDRGLKVVAFFLSIMMALFVLLLLPGFWELKRYNRNYPNTLQKHLNSPLSPKDYENVCYIAKWHPEVQPWIAQIMDKDGRILYRDAELLADKINQYLQTLPEQELKNMIQSGQKKT